MQLETERLLIREFTKSDWHRVFAYQSDPLYLRYYNWKTRFEADVQAFINIFIEAQKEDPRKTYQLAVCLKESDYLIGNCGLRINNPYSAEGNIGYEMDSHYWGRGYATEAARAILHFGFEQLKLHRIWATTLLANKGSGQVLTKIGMRLEAHEWEKDKIKGRWMDSLTFAMLDWEWRALFD